MSEWSERLQNRLAEINGRIEESQARISTLEQCSASDADSHQQLGSAVDDLRSLIANRAQIYEQIDRQRAI